MKLTPRQAEVVANLALVKTDGSRQDPMFWLGEKNVSVQVRSLLRYGFVERQNGQLVKAEAVQSERAPTSIDIDSAVSAMRTLLSEGSQS